MQKFQKWKPDCCVVENELENYIYLKHYSKSRKERAKIIKDLKKQVYAVNLRLLFLQIENEKRSI